MAEGKVYNSGGIKADESKDKVILEFDKATRFLSKSGASAMIGSTGGKAQVIISGEIWTLQAMLYRRPTAEDRKMMAGEA